MRGKGILIIMLVATLREEDANELMNRSEIEAARDNSNIGNLPNKKTPYMMTMKHWIQSNLRRTPNNNLKILLLFVFINSLLNILMFYVTVFRRYIKIYIIT